MTLEATPNKANADGRHFAPPLIGKTLDRLPTRNAYEFRSRPLPQGQGCHRRIRGAGHFQRLLAPAVPLRSGRVGMANAYIRPETTVPHAAGGLTKKDRPRAAAALSLGWASPPG